MRCMSSLRLKALEYLCLHPADRRWIYKKLNRYEKKILKINCTGAKKVGLTVYREYLSSFITILKEESKISPEKDQRINIEELNISPIWKDILLSDLEYQSKQMEPASNGGSCKVKSPPAALMCELKKIISKSYE